MEATIRDLEERVRQTVDRLRELSAERDRLESELEALHERLVGAEGGSAAAGGNGDGEGRGAAAREIADELRAALRELRGEDQRPIASKAG
jgi:chromosome segregation ATPase